jgi:hypothetical protein
MTIDLLSKSIVPQEWGIMSIDFVSLFVGLLLSASMVVASHLATQVVARDLPGTRLGLWVRYVLGCLAILAGLLVMVSWQDWVVVAGPYGGGEHGG